MEGLKDVRVGKRSEVINLKSIFGIYFHGLE